MPHNREQNGARPHKKQRTSGAKGSRPTGASGTKAIELEGISQARVTKAEEVDQGDASQAESPEPVSVLERTALTLSNNALPPQAALISTLSQFTNLRKLEMCSMKPSEPDWPEGLDSVAWLASAAMTDGATKKRNVKRKRDVGEAKDEEDHFGKHLTQLNVSGNDLGAAGDAAFDGIEVFESLVVLNVTRCSLPAVPPSILSLASLNALVLSHNSIAALPQILPNLPHLTTLILSHNNLRSLPRSTPASVPNLKKLGLSFNKLAYPPISLASSGPLEAASEDGLPDSSWSILVPDFTSCASLREVRLNGNANIRLVPSHLSSWGKGLDGGSPGLEILDLADCALVDWTSISPLLETMSSTKASANDDRRGKKGLSNLTLKGNKLADLDDYRQKILDAIPTLRVLDSQRIQKRNADISADLEATGSKVKAARTPAHPAAAKGVAEKRAATVSAKPVPSNGPASSRDDDREAPKHKRGGRGSKKKKGGELGDAEIPAAEGSTSSADKARARAGPPPPADSDEVLHFSAAEPALGVQEDETALDDDKPRKRAKRGKKAQEWGVTDEVLDIPNDGERKKEVKKKSKEQKKSKEPLAWDAGSEPLPARPAVPSQLENQALASIVVAEPNQADGRGDSGLAAIIEVDVPSKSARKGKGKGGKKEREPVESAVSAAAPTQDDVGGGAGDALGSGGASAWG